MKAHASSAISYEQIQQLITHIYDAALDPAHWEKTLESLSHILKAEQAYLRILNLASNHIQRSYSYNKDNHWTQAYCDYFIHHDPWLNSILSAKNTVIGCTHHYITDKKYEKMEFHRDFVLPQGTHYGLGGKIHIKNNISCYLALNRARNKDGFENIYHETLLSLTPHLQKALLINEKTRNIAFEHSLLRDALNQIHSPLMLVDKNRKILFINSQAEHLINQQPGICIRNNQVTILSNDDNNKLKKLIRSAIGKNASTFLSQGSSMCCTNPTTQSTISILISPVNPEMVNIDTQSDETALLLLSTNQNQKSFSTELLTDLYNFTPAEARLTSHLCQGFTLDEIAEKLSLSKNTLRSQLRSTFNKSGVSRQAELIRMVNSGPAGVINSA